MLARRRWRLDSGGVLVCVAMLKTLALIADQMVKLTVTSQASHADRHWPLS